MAVPYTFGSATAAIPLSQLDSNFATTITLGNTAIQLGNTVTTLNNMTLANVTISSGNVTLTNVSVTNANVTTTLTLSGGTANGVAYLNGSKVLTTGSALVFDGTNLGVGVTPSAWASYKAIDISSVGSLASVSGQMSVFNNSYWNGSNMIYKTTNFATYYNQNAGTHAWYNAPSGTAGNTITFTQAMTLDASGNLIVGATATQLGERVNVTGAGILIQSSAGSNRGLLGNFGSSDFVVGTYDSFALAFRTGNTERVRITSDGLVGIGQNPSAFAQFQVLFDATTSANNFLGIGVSPVANTSGAVYVRFYNATGNGVGEISRVGTTNAVIYNTSSDYRLKTVTGAVTGQGERIDALKPVDYLWKDGGQQARGFLAHEFQTVYSNSVTGDKDAVDANGNPVYQAMQAATSEVIADLIAEIQSLRQRVAQLESN